MARRPDPFTEIRMTALHATRGANYWSRRPVTRMDLDIGAYEDISSADVPTFTDQLVGALPSLEEHRCSVGTRGGFVKRLRDGTYAAHITEHVALALQEAIGHDVGFGRTRGAGGVGEYTLVFEHVHEGVGLRAAALGLETVQRAFAGSLDDVSHAVAELAAIAESPNVPPPRQHVLCGITGGSARGETRDALRMIGGDSLVSDSDLIVDIAPMYLLQAGLPYSRSDVAIVLDTELMDVPERYRDPERAARLVSVVADAVCEEGDVVCPSTAHYVHDLVRDAGRRVVKFQTSSDPGERAARAAEVAAECLARRVAA